MGNDDELPKLPEWIDFRERGHGEELVAYLQAKFESDIMQERDRDHWFMQVFTAMIGNADLLHMDLMGDGTILRPGILPQLMRAQQEQVDRLAQLPNMVKQIVKEAHSERAANEWTAVKKWTFGMLAAVLSSVSAAVILFLVLHK